MKQITASIDRIAARYERKLNLHDPEYNLREIAKQLILLEDHLGQPHKLCPDCIRKHLFTIEALAEEMISLSNPKYLTHRLMRQTGSLYSELARKWLQEFNDGVDPAKIAVDVRILRKSTVDTCPDPRRDEEDYDSDSIDRVASMFIFKDNSK